MGAVFSSSGGYLSAQDYVNGLRPAMFVGALVVAIGVVTALIVPSRRTLSAPALASLAAESKRYRSTMRPNGFST